MTGGDLNGVKGKARRGMDSVWTILIVVVVWLLLTRVVLPRLGVPT